MKIPFTCIALLGFLVFGLGLVVSLARGKTRRNYGAPEDPTSMLYKLVRAHANAAEYVPMLAVIILLASRLSEPWVLWTMGIVTAARYLHAAGMVLAPTLDRVFVPRFLGAFITYVGGIVLCAAVLRDVW